MLIIDEEIYEALRKQKPRCAECGKEMKNAKDSITKKVSKYLWELNCKCKSMENFKLARG